MNEFAMTKILLLLELFALMFSISHSEHDILADTTITLSPEEKALVSSVPLDQQSRLADIIMKNYIYSSQHASLATGYSSLATGYSSLATGYSSLATRYHGLQSFMPQVDLNCAMAEIKTNLARFFGKHVKTAPMSKLRYVCEDPHIETIVTTYDQRPTLVEPNEWKDQEDVDSVFVQKLCNYAITVPQEGKFEPADMEANHRTMMHKTLFDRLGSYYDKLDDEIKKKDGYKSLDEFKVRFSWVMTRCHRFSCHYHHSISPVIDDKVTEYKMKGKELMLSEAILEVMPTWYFDEEHVDLLNLMQGVLGLPDRFYVIKKIKNSKHISVAIPGLPNCAKEKNIPPDFYEKIYSLAP